MYFVQGQIEMECKEIKKTPSRFPQNFINFSVFLQRSWGKARIGL